MSIAMQDILVVHPNAGRRAALASALPLYRVVAVESKVEAAYLMAGAAPALIIAPADGARHFLREVASAAPNALRVFICSQSDAVGLAELVQSAAEGHVFSVLDEGLSGPELGRTLSYLLQHRGSGLMAVSASAYTVHFQAGEDEYEARCQEVGNFGATLLLRGGPPLPSFPPGMMLEALCLEDLGRVVLNVPCAHVQRTQLLHGEGGAQLRLEISWANAMHPPPSVPGVTMEEQSEVVATLRKALRREATLWLQRPQDPSVQLRLEQPGVELVDGVALLRGRSSGSFDTAQQDEEVDLFFEMGGQSYSGVVRWHPRGGPGVLSMQVPSSLVVRNWRGLPRFKPSPEERYLISFLAPFTGQRTTRAVLDLSFGGLSFPFDAASELLPAGSRVPATLQLPDGSSSDCLLEVRSIHSLPSDGHTDGGLRPYRAGARVMGVSQAAQEVIQRSFMRSRCASIFDGAGVSFPELWGMMEAARYRFHPDYPFNNEPAPDVLADTHRKVYSSGDLGRCLLYTNDKGLQGQIATLRMHSRTWLVQHLAVRPGVRRDEQVSYELSNLAVELSELQHDIEFIRYSWRKDNRWPRRRIGWLARALETRGLSFLRHFSYMRLPLTEELPTAPSGLPRVREGERKDYVWIELYLRARGELVRVLSEDLLTDEVDLAALGERYKAHGLHRRRRVFIVDGEGGPLGVALCEEGTPGLNLLEKSNAFWLMVPDRAHPQADAAIQALVQRCATHARERGRPSAIGFVEDEDVAALTAAGFQNLGRFSEWIFHRSMVRRVCELWRSVFERLGGAPAPDWSAEEPTE